MKLWIDALVIAAAALEQGLGIPVLE